MRLADRVHGHGKYTRKSRCLASVVIELSMESAAKRTPDAGQMRKWALHNIRVVALAFLQ
jgi:hypothetical protein